MRFNSAPQLVQPLANGTDSARSLLRVTCCCSPLRDRGVRRQRYSTRHARGRVTSSGRLMPRWSAASLRRWPAPDRVGRPRRDVDGADAAAARGPSACPRSVHGVRRSRAADDGARCSSKDGSYRGRAARAVPRRSAAPCLEASAARSATREQRVQGGRGFAAPRRNSAIGRSVAAVTGRARAARAPRRPRGSPPRAWQRDGAPRPALEVASPRCLCCSPSPSAP